MTDLRVLTDAFAELERRADAAKTSVELEPARRSRPMPRLVPIAATVAVVAGLGAGAMWLVPGDNAAPQVGSQSTSTVPTATAPAGAPVTPEELSERFQRVLGDTATFETTGPGTGVIEIPDGPDGAQIVGTLTVAGVTGGFDLAVFPAPRLPGDIECECTPTTLPDGSLLITGDSTIGSDDITRSVRLHRADGVQFVMLLSNESSPKGNGEKLAEQPPLTVDQMVAIVTSDQW
jgi:hypothetical protein